MSATYYGIALVGEFYNDDGPGTHFQEIDPEEKDELFRRGFIASSHWVLYGMYDGDLRELGMFETFPEATQVFYELTGQPWIGSPGWEIAR